MSQQQSIYNQVVKLTVSSSLLYSSLGMTCWPHQFKVSFDRLLKSRQVWLHVPGLKRLITRLQKSPANKKMESVLARLERLGAEGDTVGYTDEFERREQFFK